MAELVGILNLTPDSFSDGGQFNDPATALDRVAKLFQEGAAYVDVGAESTRPGAAPLTAHREWQRLESVLPQLILMYPNKISLDTYHPETAARALRIGNVIINDVTGLQNPQMVSTILAHQARCIISHLPSQDVQTAHDGQLINDEQQIIDDLLKRAGGLEKLGLNHGQIILDPGIGFGKTPELNKRLLKFAQSIPNYPVMIGYSRKRFLGDNRLATEPNLEAGRVAISAGAAFLRVHDVAAHRQLLY